MIMRTPDAPGILKIRETLGNLMRQKSVSPDATEAARVALLSMLEEASEYGLTSADVIRSVFSPVFGDPPGCYCPSCRSRRSQAHLDNLEGAGAQWVEDH